MKRNSLILSVAALIVVGCAGTRTESSRVTNYTSEGNLEALHPVGCVSSAGVSSRLTPAELYPGVARCMESGNVKDGAFLFMLAGAYGRFDRLRVADTTAHQAITVIQMSVFEPIDQSIQQPFRAEMVKILDDKVKHSELCREIRNVGMPSYFPRYMIQHGMRGFLGGGTKDGIVEGFEPKSAWDSVLIEYAHCRN